MSRSFISNLFFLIAINLLIKPFYVLAIDVGVQNKVGATAYGLYFSIFNFCYIFQIIADLGIQHYNSKTISQNRSLVSEWIPSILGLKIILSFFFLAFVGFAGFAMGYPKSYYALLWIIAINQILLSFTLYLRTNISGLGLYWIDSLYSVIDKIILISILGYLLWFYEQKALFTISWLLWAQTFSLGITITFLIFYLYKKLGFFVPKFSFSFSSSLLKKSIPYAISVLLMSIYTRIDGVMLERLLLDQGTQAGIYAAGYRLLDAINMIGYLFAALLLPMLSHAISEKTDILNMVDTSFRIIMVISISASIFCLFYSHDIMSFLYVDSTPYYGQILKVLMFGFIGIGGMYIFGTLGVADGQIRYLNYIFCLGIIINVVLNWIFIPRYGGLAAAYTTLITQFFVFLSQIWVGYRYSNISIRSVTWLKLGIYSVLFLSIMWTIRNIMISNLWIAFGLSITAAILVSLLIKIIRIDQLKEVFNLNRRPF